MHKHGKPEKKGIPDDCELTNFSTNIDDIPIIKIDEKDCYDLRGLSKEETLNILAKRALDDLKIPS